MNVLAKTQALHALYKQYAADKSMNVIAGYFACWHYHCANLRFSLLVEDLGLWVEIEVVGKVLKVIRVRSNSGDVSNTFQFMTEDMVLNILKEVAAHFNTGVEDEADHVTVCSEGVTV